MRRETYSNGYLESYNLLFLNQPFLGHMNNQIEKFKFPFYDILLKFYYSQNEFFFL